MRRREPRYRFPWREGNRFSLLVDGEQFFPHMLEAIRAARHHLLLEMYLVNSGALTDRFVGALADAAARGVRLYLLFDDFGARGLHARDRKTLHHAGAHLVFYNPLDYGKHRRNLFRDHRKLLCIDGETVFVGGTGLSDEFDPQHHGKRRWHEMMVKVQGPVVADWEALFQENWQRWSDIPIETLGALPATAGDQSGRITTNQRRRPTEVKSSLLKHIRAAERRVWLATAYFIPSWKIRRALRHAARAGVDVRLLLPGPYCDHPAVRHAGRRFYARLLRHGVRIYEYQPSFLHAKAITCDNWSSVGSSNVDRWNLRWNLEANQEIDDRAFAEQLAAMFERDFSESVEFDYESWRRRPWYLRLLERFWGGVDLWLEREGERSRTGE